MAETAEAQATGAATNGGGDDEGARKTMEQLAGDEPEAVEEEEAFTLCGTARKISRPRGGRGYRGGAAARGRTGGADADPGGHPEEGRRGRVPAPRDGRR